MAKRRIDKSWYERPRGVKTRTSAGGVIVRLERKTVWVALARERSQAGYMLPKGGVDKGESLVDAARREIKEEAGFRNLKKLGKLAVCERLNYSKTRWITTHYYLFLTQETKVRPTERWRHRKPHWFLLEDMPVLFWPEQDALIRDNRKKICAWVESTRGRT